MQALKKTLNKKSLKLSANSLNTVSICAISQNHNPQGYVRGFRNTQFQEAIPGSLPKNTNPKYGQHNLVTEQFTGPQGFTGEASANGPLRTYMYKKERSIKVQEYKKSENPSPFQDAGFDYAAPNPIRLSPPPKPSKKTDFTEGFIPIADNEHVLHYQYSFNSSMSSEHKVFHNIDGEIMISPAVGKLQIITELGILDLEPGFIGVIPKNMKIQVNLVEGDWAQGTVTELKNDKSYRLPHRGPIGANGLANPEYFETPTPYVDQINFNVKHKIVSKKQDQYYEAVQNTSPFDVQAWKGNYAPYRFNLDDFVPVIAGQKDHIDPSSHLLFAIPQGDGANCVEVAVFAPRANITTDKTPSYLPPYDHRNTGKSEIMHYLGGYDARVGTSAGSQTIHEMGVAHGNDQATFEKGRMGPNKTVFLEHKPATMIEVTGPLRFSKYVQNNFDPKYLPQLRGDDATPSYLQKIPEADLGYVKKLTFTALQSSLTSLFDILMPNPNVIRHEQTGITIKQYRNSRGDIFEVQYQEDQSVFWDTIKELNTDYAKLDIRNPEKASDEELKIAARVMKSFFNRGTVVNAMDIECENAEATYNYFISKGFKQGFDKNCVVMNENAPLNFRFINKGEFEIKPNKDALVTSIDHTVINVYREQVQRMFDMFPETFWGGDPRDLRTTGVQFDTRVLSSNLKDVKQLIPVNNLDATEELILHRMQDGDTYLPPYIKDAAFGNQITRGLYDTNRTLPKMSKDGFLQHIAMSVNTNFGDISYHLENLKKNKVRLIPAPPDLYYELSEVDLGQRVLLPKLFELAGVDAWELPFDFFNGLLKPKDANVERLNEILIKDCRWMQEDATPIVEAYKKIQPVLEVVGNNILKYEAKSFRELLVEALKKQKLDSSENTVDTFVKLIEFNKKKIQRAQNVGSLIDFQIVVVGGNNQTGYLDQTFSVPLTQGSEGTTGIFLEFIVRTSYDEIFELMKSGEFYKKDDSSFKSCGAFGQGNFGNLMLGQQQGIKKMDEQIKKKAAAGKAFKLPLLDFDTINTQPLDHMDLKLMEAQKKGLKTETLDQTKANIEKIISECKKRGFW